MNYDEIHRELNKERSLLRSIRNCFTVNKFKARLPIAQWLPKYSKDDLKGDVIAGLSVSLTLIPQALAMALLAQLPLRYGLYSSFVGPFLYILFGSCKDITIGPTSIMAIITAQYVLMGGLNYALLLSFLAGIIQLITGFLNLGFLVEFIPFPVISGFSSAAAITIIMAQLKLFLGIPKHNQLVDIFTDIHIINLWDATLGAMCLIILITLKLVSFRLAEPVNVEKAPILMRNEEKKKNYGCCASFVKAVITSRNALLVMICGTVVYFTKSTVFTLTDRIEPGLPSFQLPNFTEYRNGTQVMSFLDIIEEINFGMLAVALLSLLETIAIAKSIENSSESKSLQRSFNATQEMIALGLSNLIGSFFGSFPVTGSFSRSAINHSSGVRTPLSNLITGAMVLLALSEYIAPCFAFIPQTTLASVIISSVIFMIKPNDLNTIWNSNKIDLLPYFVTFITAISYSLEFGILFGSGVSLLLIAYSVMRPEIEFKIETFRTFNYLVIKPNQSILYPSAEYLKTKILKSLCFFRNESTNDVVDYNVNNQFKFAIVIDCIHVNNTDSTFALSFTQFVKALKKKDVLVVLYRASDALLNSLNNSIANCNDMNSLQEILATYFTR
ncbi:sulfate/anion exchanger-like protein [Leptotrombidium deliense]|uniref:Sulfate/anion exchanger-like protein n=2 Tax=Leptotrombidium deliense TaxID=299467 RepID=A0A443SH89_9ACAR|nr:sulfate/anion exchanger-like protein [Leptotrombidium deliense]